MAAKKKRPCGGRGRLKSGKRKGQCRPKGSRKTSRKKRLAAAVCRKGYQLAQHNPMTGKKYKRPRCATATKRGKVKTHAPRKVAGVKVAKIIAVG